MSEITNIRGIEILDSRGNPTVAANGALGPAGADDEHHQWRRARGQQR